MSRTTLRAGSAVALTAALAAGSTGLLGTTPAHAAAPQLPLSVNFQPQTATTPTGYLSDYGQAFDDDRGFGWLTLDGAPLSLVGNGRERNAVSDQRLDTIMQMQLKPGSGGVSTPGRWEAVVPNGSYEVTVAVGDPSYTDSRHVINVEGVKAIDFTPTSANRQSAATRTTTVTDGRLTVDATGGTNTKLAYVTVQPDVATDQQPRLGVTMPEDELQLGSRLVFSTVKNQSRPGHDLTLSNTGPGPLKVSGLVFSGPQAADFELCAGQPAQLTVAAGGKAAVCVQYRPKVDSTTEGLQTSQATLTINSNDPDDAAYEVGLGGVNPAEYEGSSEPSLQAIVDTLGYRVDVAVSNRPQKNSISGSSEAFGDEVLAPYFTKLDSSKKVSLVPLAHYSGRNANNSTRFGWYAKGSSTSTFLYQFPGGTATGGANNGYGQNQLLLPAITGGVKTFDPAGQFGIVNQEGIRSDDTLNLGEQKLHNVRAYPARDADGDPIAGAWLVAMDIGSPIRFTSKNWDYQDYVLLVLNAQPASTDNRPTGGLDSQSLTGFPGTGAGVAGSGFTSVQGAVDLSKVSFTNNQLRIASSDDTNTSHTNALQLAVNGDSRFRIQSRLLGPFDFLNAGSEQQAIFWGIDEGNYLKAEVEWWGGDRSRHLTIWQQANGSGKVVKTIPLPAGSVNSIDLRIDGDPSPSSPYNGPPTVNVTYAINGSTNFTSINGTTTPVPIPSDWVRSLTYAGVMTSHQGGGTEFTARYGNFSAVRR